RRGLARDRHRARAGREENGRVERPHREQRVPQYLNQDERHEDVEPRLTQELPKLCARDRPYAPEERRRLPSHAERGERAARRRPLPRRRGGRMLGLGPAPEGLLRCHDTAQRPGYRSLRQENRAEPERDQPCPVQPKERVVWHGLFVIELHPTVDLEIRLVEPAVPRGLDPLKELVHAQVEPGWRPGP